MPLDRLVLIITCVIAAAGATIWVVAALFASSQASPLAGVAMLSIVALAAYIGWRVISERLSNKDDDHYDRFEN